MGCFRALRVTRNRIPNFSSCLDKAVPIVVELFKSPSNFSILSNKLTSITPFTVSLQIRLHCRLRTHVPIQTPNTSNINPNAKGRFPVPPRTVFLEVGTAQLIAKPIEITADENIQTYSSNESKDSKLKLFLLLATPSLCTAPSDSKTLRRDWRFLGEL